MIFTAGLMEEHGKITAVLDVTDVSRPYGTLIVFDTRGETVATRGYNVSQDNIGRQLTQYSDFVQAMEKLLAGDSENPEEVAAHICGYMLRRLCR